LFIQGSVIETETETEKRVETEKREEKSEKRREEKRERDVLQWDWTDDGARQWNQRPRAEELRRRPPQRTPRQKQQGKGERGKGLSFSPLDSLSLP
jgi:hypothetical protein